MEFEETITKPTENHTLKDNIEVLKNMDNLDDVDKNSDCLIGNEDIKEDSNDGNQELKSEVSKNKEKNTNAVNLVDSEINNVEKSDTKLDSNKSHDDSTECSISNDVTPKNDESGQENDSNAMCSDIDKSDVKNSPSKEVEICSEISSAEKIADNTLLDKNDVVELKEDGDKEKNSIDKPSKELTTANDEEVDIKIEPEPSEKQDISEVSKKKEESGKKKKGKTCVECGKKKKIEFRMHFQGKVHALCSEQCYKQFKEKQGSPKPPVETPKAAEKVPESFCPLCQRLILPNRGYYPLVGSITALCSEDCVRKYQDNNGPPRKCSQCDSKVEDKSCHLTWETMVFCTEECLGKYQSFLGSHCTCCQAPVQQASLGKYCVCFGSDIRQFCSGSCLDDFKKGLKVCTFCQTDLSAGTEGFLAPVGDKGQFKDFCSQGCMERYETMNSLSKNLPDIQECAHCQKQGIFKIQVPYKDKTYSLCCDNCVAGLRCTLKKTELVCSSCHSFFECSSDLNSNKENDFKLKMDGLYKFFCSKTCMTTYVLSHRRITQCLFCKVKKYNFDMIEKTEPNTASQIFCSLNCLSLYRVNVNAASSKNIRCDNCSKSHPAQYHLTMSDGSIRNFCTYSCVLAFQNQFTNVPALTTTSMTRQATTPVQTLKTTQAINSPVIANVVSLAQTRTGTPTLPKTLVPQTLVSVRPPPRQPVTVFTAKPQISSTATSSSVPGQTVSASSQVMREVIVQPPAPKSVKNKTVWCKPIMQTKGISVKTPSCNKAVQTDDNPRPIILPIPVPLYVPVPLHMFSRPVPCPVPFPVPIPIPIIMPSSKESQNQIMKHLRKSQKNMPSNSHGNEVSESIELSTNDSNRSLSDTEQDKHIYYIKQKKGQKRNHSSQKHKKLKKIKVEENIQSEESRNSPTTDDDSSSSSSPSSPSPLPGPSFQHTPSDQNSVFETPHFNFEEEEQTMLKVP